MTELFKQFMCWAFHHGSIKRTRGSWMWLECTTCLRTTAGWSTKP